MQAAATSVGRPGAVGRVRPSSKATALPARYGSVKLAGPTAGKMFVGQPLGMQRRQRVPQEAPQEQRPSASVGDASGAGDEKMILGASKKTWNKIIPLGLMFFCILFNYTILRDTKDVLVVTAPGSGAEIIPYLKTYVNLPLAFLFTIGYSQAAEYLSLQQLFYLFIIPFITFFGLFPYAIYPNIEALHPTEWAKNAVTQYGERWAGAIAVIRNWTFCMFYVAAELWGSVVVSVLFWGFANNICLVDEAKRFYPFFGLGANVALIFSGQAVRHYSNVRANLPPGVDGWQVSLQGMMQLVVAFGLGICALRYYLQKTTVETMTGDSPTKASTKKKKEKMNVADSFKYLAASTYIRSMATLVVAYGISINLVEVTWKGRLKAQYPNPNDYSSFMGNFSTATGIVTFCLMLVSQRILTDKKNLNVWKTAASITPVVLGITGLAFFGLILFGSQLDPVMKSLGVTPLFAAVIVGAAQNIFSKGAKYSLFDPTKEMAYIPLDTQMATKGKAAIDVICNPLGKSGGAFIQQIMIFVTGSLAASTPYLGFFLVGTLYLWIQAIGSLSIEFKEKQAQNEMERIKEAGNE